MIFSKLPFYIKGYVLSFIGDYKFRKGKWNEIFMHRISKEIMEYTKELFENTPIIITWKKEMLWKSYIEFSKVSPIWRIIRQNFEYFTEEDILIPNITTEIICFYERKYYSSNHIYKTPIL